MSVVSYLLLLEAYISFSHALPVQSTLSRRGGNSTLPSTGKVAWFSPPQLRGTSDLLISCLTTLSLCAWTAYHPNVHSGRSEWKRMLHRATWMLIAIIAPEAVLLCAWEQWWATRRLKDQINGLGEKAFDEDSSAADDVDKEEMDCYICGRKAAAVGFGEEDYGLERLFDEESQVVDAINPHTSTSSSILEKPANPTDQNQPSSVQVKDGLWTMEQAFFALSGGYAIPSPSHASAPPLTLTPTGLLFLARLGLLPNIPLPTISDKSKADHIAKALVCIQAGWFLIQCIARVAQKLSLTVLEVHVLAHVLCAFVMYAVWIDKPYDVASPILLDGERTRELGALWACDDGQSDDKYGFGSVEKCAHKPCILALDQVRPSYDLPATHYSSASKYKRLLLSYLGIKRSRSKPSEEIQNPPIQSTPEMAEHLALANRALEYLRQRRSHFQYVSKATVTDPGDEHAIPGRKGPSIKYGTSIRIPGSYIVRARSNLIVEGLDEPTKTAKEEKLFNKQVSTYMVMSSLYGAFHLIAWSPSHFPTLVETWLWRGSALAMVAAPVLVSLGYSSQRLSEVLLPRFPRQKSHFLWDACKRFVRGMMDSVAFFGICVGIIWWGAYPFARLYVLVESFAGLRSVDHSVYQTVEWTNFIPHAG